MADTPQCRNGCNAGAIFKETPDLSHYGMMVCPKCDSYITWVAKPKNAKVRRRKPSKKLLRPHRAAGIDYCVWCLRKETELPVGMRLQAHHIVPLEYGGSNDPSNIVPLCDGCHALCHNQRRTVGKLDKSNKLVELREVAA